MNIYHQRESKPNGITDSSPPDGIPEPNSDLLAALEELQKAQKTLSEQNEELRRARETAEEERLRYQDLFNFAPDAYLLTDPTGKIEEANYAAAVLLNMSQQLLIGENLPSFVSGEERITIENRLNWLRNKIWPIQEWEVLLCPPNKQTFDASLRVGTFRYRERKAISLRWLVRDISAHKTALAREKELSELKSRFISMASHEFRTPLATILTSSDLLKCYSHKLTDDKKLKHLNKIQAQVNNMTQILDDVLFIGKTEAGRIDLNPFNFNLKEFCQEVLEQIEMIDSKKHPVFFKYQAESSIVNMDQKILRQIMLNLLSNAVKYSPTETPVYFNVVYEYGEAIFEIRDEGIGIPVSDRANLFEVFHRASNVGNISGTGLGMAIVKRAVEVHGGSISFESAEGIGTTFTVCIPTIDVDV